MDILLTTPSVNSVMRHGAAFTALIDSRISFFVIPIYASKISNGPIECHCSNATKPYSAGFLLSVDKIYLSAPYASNALAMSG